MIVPSSGPPTLRDLGTIFAIEGANFSQNLENEMEEAFPYPRSFSWEKDGNTVENTTRQSFGYPDLRINPVSRDDSGVYTLTATNYRLDNESVEIGSDSGSFTLDVLCKDWYHELLTSTVQYGGLRTVWFDTEV